MYYSSTEASHPEATLTSLKCFGGLTRPSECLKNFIFQAEDIFVTFINESLTCSNVQTFLLSKSSSLLESADIPSCHDIGRKLLIRFFRLRSHIRCKSVNKSHENLVQHGSKSAKARSVVK